jgi:hypothetical protein
MKYIFNTKFKLLAATSLVLAGCMGSDITPPPPPRAEVPPLPKFEQIQEPTAAQINSLELLPMGDLPPLPELPELNFTEKEVVVNSNSKLVDMPSSGSAETDIPFETSERMARLDAAKFENQPRQASTSSTTSADIITPSKPGNEIVAVSKEDPAATKLAPTPEPRADEAIQAVEVQEESIIAQRAAEPSQPVNPLVAPKPLQPKEVATPKKKKKSQQNDETLQPERLVMKQQDGGIVVTRGDILPGEAAGSLLPDCQGDGTVVRVETATGVEEQVLDIDGTLCTEANILFDGNSAVGQRAAAPGIAITMHQDSLRRPVLPADAPAGRVFYGDVPQLTPETLEDFAQLPANQLPRTIVADVKGIDAPGSLSQSELAEMEALADNPAALPERGRLAATIQNWQEKSTPATPEEAALAESLQADLEDIRQQAASQLARDYQQQVEDLASQLRETEVQRDLTERRYATITERLEQGLQRNEAERQQWRQEQRRLGEESAALAQRISEMEQRNERLKSSYAQREQAYVAKIAQLERDLEAAESKASAARQELVLEAAQKIAEAERLAFAANMAKKDELERRSARLKLEGSLMEQRAQDIDAGRQVVVPGLTGQFGDEAFPPVTELPQDVMAVEPALPPFAALPVQIQVRDLPLEDVFRQVFNQLSPAIGSWQISWELEGKNATIARDEYTVTAETTLGDFLSYVQAEVEKTHGVKLKYQRFDKIRSLVITD